MGTTSGDQPRWARVCLLAAALQCLIWGPFIILAPTTAGAAYGFARPPEDEFLWQGMGLVILLYGLGYAVAAFDPYRHYAVVLVGLLAKVLGPVGMTWAVAQEQVSVNVLWLIPIHDVIWWWPFAMIVMRGCKWGRLSAREIHERQ
ncbi:MAG: alkyl hydroperoxide reductase [Planctomycetota bacterium]